MNPDSTVGQLVVERPARARVFEKFGIDYCCGGKKPLAAVCSAKGLDISQVLLAIDIADSVSTLAPAQDWSQGTLTDLARHIETTHHAYLKSELPRLDYLTERVFNAHGGRHAELAQLRAVFVAFKEELEQHMQKEERILFPLCRNLECGSPSPDVHCGSIANPIAVMEREHDDAGNALAQMRQLTNDYTPPAGACNTYRAMLSSLAELEADMHQHVHKENNILFPRAIALEAA
jgi:regulator of cell morphogenesis and NO signaling